MSALNKFLEDDIKLPSPPAIAIKILRSVKEENSDYKELSKIISADPALTAKTLKVANSSFYALPRKVEKIEKAIALIGANALKNIALSFVIAKKLTRASEDAFDFEFFWKRSVTAAIAADLFTNITNRKSDDTFVTGLLQDIGIVIMYLCKPDDYLAVLNEKKVVDAPIIDIEKRIFGFDHQEIGSETLKNWGLPENIYIPIGNHHTEKKSADKYRLLVDALKVSDKLSSIYHGLHSVEKIEGTKKILGTFYGIEEKEVENLIDSVADKSIERLSFFDIDPGDMKPYSEILQEANEELGKLNLSYEYLLIKYKQEKERAQSLAYELKDKNEKLSKKAIMDGLTGLYNHRYFQELLDKELDRAKRYAKPFTLIMFDLDHFKKINDSYGHRAGDIVLQKVSKLVQKTVRNSDSVARYGGEEFMIILPDTGSKKATVLAERIRKDVQQMEIKVDHNIIKTTISLGIATFLQDKIKTEKTDILDAVDSALYISKNKGRNSLSIAKVGC